MTRKVHFSDQMEVHAPKHLDSMLPEEVASLWFSKQDYKVMKSVDQMIIKSMANGSPQSHDCLRGLESMTPEGAMAKRNITVEAVCAVLEEQKRQRSEGIRNSAQIAAIYAEVSANSMKTARQKGIMDVKALCVDDADADSFGLSYKLALSLAEGILPKKQQSTVTKIQGFFDRAKSRGRLSRTAPQERI